MNKKEQIKLVPKYRFPEFTPRGSVVCENGNMIFKPVNNKNHGSELPVLAISQEYGAIPRDMIDYNVSVSEKSLESYKVVEKGDFIISLRSFQGGIEYSTYNGICSPAYIILRKKVDVDEQYYKFYFKSNRFIQDLNRDLEGIRDGKMVSYNQFSDILLPKPDKEEQQKIADCLSSIDDLISAEDKKLSALKDHKKGLMQKLFPAEGKTVPEWRFPEFRGCKEWEEKILSDVGQIITGKTPSTADSTLWNGDIQFVTPTDIDDAKYQLKTQRTVALNNKMNILPPKSIMFTCIASIGKIALSIFPCITNQQINSVIPHSKYNNEFIYYALYKKAYYIKLQLASTTLPIVNKTDFSKFIITIPKNPEEQQKIVDVLSSVDELITAQSEKIESLKQHKKGLLQGLFPSIEEVSQ